MNKEGECSWYENAFNNRHKVDEKIEELLNKKVSICPYCGKLLISSEEVFDLLIPEKQQMIKEMDYCLFYGEFGWAFTSKGKNGISLNTASCITLSDIKEKNE